MPQSGALCAALLILRHEVCAKETSASGWGMSLELARQVPTVSSTCASQPESGIVVDVGARGGGETRLALEAGYKVVAIECSRDAFAAFANSYTNNPRVHAHYGCASEHNGTATFHLAGDSSSLKQGAVTIRKEERKKRPKAGAAQSTTVPLLVVDELLAAHTGPVCAVKIDVQGNELGVFKGMVRTLAKHRPVLYFEHSVVNLGNDADVLLPWVKAKGYHCHPHHRRACEYCNVLCTPDRVLRQGWKEQ